MIDEFNDTTKASGCENTDVLLHRLPGYYAFPVADKADDATASVKATDPGKKGKGDLPKTGNKDT